MVLDEIERNIWIAFLELIFLDDDATMSKDLPNNSDGKQSSGPALSNSSWICTGIICAVIIVVILSKAILSSNRNKSLSVEENLQSPVINQIWVEHFSDAKSDDTLILDLRKRLTYRITGTKSISGGDVFTLHGVGKYKISGNKLLLDQLSSFEMSVTSGGKRKVLNEASKDISDQVLLSSARANISESLKRMSKVKAISEKELLLLNSDGTQSLFRADHNGKIK